MRIKLDENLHVGLAAAFTAAGHDTNTVADEGLLGADDVRTYPPGSHAGVLVLRLDDQSFPSAEGAVRELVRSVDLEALAGCVAVYRDGELRVRRPPTG